MSTTTLQGTIDALSTAYEHTHDMLIKSMHKTHDLYTLVLLYGASVNDEERTRADQTLKSLFPDLHAEVIEWREHGLRMQAKKNS